MDPIADVEGGIADALDTIAVAEGVTADVEGGIADAEGDTEIAEETADTAIDVENTAVGEANLASNAEESSGIITDFVYSNYRTLLLLFTIATIWITVMETATSWVTGMNNHIKCASKEFNNGFDDSMIVTGILLECSWDKFIKFWNGDCTRYYIANMIFGLLYGVLIELPVVLINAIFGIDLQPIVNFFYEVVIVPINDIVYAMSGFYIVKWTDPVIKKCFTCKGKIPVNNGWSEDMHKPMNEWAELYNCSGAQMRQGLGRFFGTILPSDRWSEWANRRHQSGSDWNPSF